MTNTTTRTPTRFSIGSNPTTIVGTGPDGQPIVVAVTETLGATHSYGQMCADARFIVRACNSHEKLTKALRNLIDALNAHDTLHAQDGDYVARMVEYSEAYSSARAALAAAESA